jgi:capsular exopolysaccharide synthesis family protein
MRYLQALRRHWFLIATLIVLAVAAAALSTHTATKRYTASADLLVRPLSSNDDTYRGFNSLFQQTLDGSSTVVTAAKVIASPEIKVPCLSALPAAARGASIGVQPLGQADVIEIVANSSSAARTAAAANAFAACTVANRSALYQSELRSRITQIKARVAAIPADTRSGNFEYATLQQSLATYTSSLGTANPTLSILTTAATPVSPVWPRPKLAIAASLLIALLLGVGIAFLLEFVSPRISREDELQLQQRLPILARVPRLPGGTGRGYLTGKSPLPPQAWKSYRVLRAVLANAGKTGGYPRTILVTSAMPGDGKTTTAINLAMTLAAADLRVVLVDADVHRPMVASFFNVAAHRNGFTRLLSGEGNLRQVLVDAPLDAGLKLVLAGHEPGGYAGLTEERFGQALERLSAVADVVVIDSPPLPEVAEVLEMASAAEVVVIAVRLGRTRRDKLGEVRELLARRRVTPAGFVVTTRDRVERETHYDYPGEVPRPTRHLDSVGGGGTPPRAAAGRQQGV